MVVQSIVQQRYCLEVLYCRRVAIEILHAKVIDLVFVQKQGLDVGIGLDSLDDLLQTRSVDFIHPQVQSLHFRLLHLRKEALYVVAAYFPRMEKHFLVVFR